MDFEQGKITTIHDFHMVFDHMRSRLKKLNKKYPSGVIIPVIGEDLSNPSMQKILNNLNECDYLNKIFIALATNEDSDYDRAVKMTNHLKVPCDVIWCNKPEVAPILKELKRKGLDLTKSKGKGRDLWIAIGIASLELHAMAIHDADIVTYDSSLPTRLLYSIVEPKLDFSFAKGYYARVNVQNKRMHGRIYRLFINPLIDALQIKLNHRSSFLRYLQAFRYALAGEMAIYSDLAINLRIPDHWGLELGILSELYRNVSIKRVCQVDLGFFDHKHKKLDKRALCKTAEDGFITLLRTLTESEGIDVSESFLLSLQVTYRRFAQDRIRQYNADASCNGLDFDRHQEESAVEILSKIIAQAGIKYVENPTSAQLPDWVRTMSAMPDARERLRSATVAEK